MANIKDDSDNGDFIYVSEDTDDDNASKYEFARRVAVDSLVSKRSPEWTEHESSVLLEAWGEKLLERNRKHLRTKAWLEVAEKISQVSEFKRTKTNCCHRLDTLKKKYKKEKAMLAQNIGSSSNWVHFSKMDMLVCPYLYEANGHGLVNSEVHLISDSPSDERTSCIGGKEENEKEEEEADVVEKGHGSVNFEVHLSSATSSGKLTKSLGGNSESEKKKDDNFVEIINLDENADLDGPPRKKPRMGKEKSGDDCLKLLANSVDKFTDLYDKVEKSKSTKLVEIKKIKMDFKRDMELQKGEFMKTALIEIAKIHRADIEDTHDL